MSNGQAFSNSTYDNLLATMDTNRELMKMLINNQAMIEVLTKKQAAETQWNRAITSSDVCAYEEVRDSPMVNDENSPHESLVLSLGPIDQTKGEKMEGLIVTNSKLRPFK